MWKIFCYTSVLSLALGFSAHAQTQSNQNFEPNGTIVVPSSSSSYNQQGFNLPSAQRATGQDIIRGSGGISCQSAIGGNGPVLDMGVIGTNDIYSRDSAALYGRITIPLGKKAKRVDCTKLYDLEIERLRMELKMMRTSSVSGGLSGVSEQERLQQIFAEMETSEPRAMRKADPASEVQQSTTPMTLSVGQAPTTSHQAEVQHPAIAPAVVTKPAETPSLTLSAKPVRKSVAPAKLDGGTPSLEPIFLHREGGQPLKSSGPTYMSQLGAFSSLASAKKAWGEYKGNVPNDFVSYETIVKPRLIRGKTLYLLQAGPFAKKDSSRICDALTKDCFSVKA